MMHVTDKEYKEHKVFFELDQYIGFYESMSLSIMRFATMGADSAINIDTYIYSSMQGTVDSMKAVLHAGRINDAYALMRKYYDSAVISIYSNTYLQDHFSINNFVVEKINNWLKGKEALPRFPAMSRYIKKSNSLGPINKVFDVDERYEQLRKRCNDHAHYNFYRYALLNDNEVYLSNRGWWLDRFSKDVRDIFIFHLGYIFFANGHYMMSSDHLDALECGMQPDHESQYWVASFIQTTFDNIITPTRPDVTTVIKEATSMHLS